MWKKIRFLLWIFYSPIYVKLISKALVLWVAVILRKNLTFNHHILNEFSRWGDLSLINYSRYKLVSIFLFIILQICCYLFNVQLWRNFQIIDFCVSEVFLEVRNISWLKSSQCLLDSYGADVTHPHPREDSIPSIAAVGFQYRSLFVVVLVHTIHMRNAYLNILGIWCKFQVVASQDWPEVTKN